MRTWVGLALIVLLLLSLPHLVAIETSPTNATSVEAQNGFFDWILNGLKSIASWLLASLIWFFTLVGLVLSVMMLWLLASLIGFLQWFIAKIIALLLWMPLISAGVFPWLWGATGECTGGLDQVLGIEGLTNEWMANVLGMLWYGCALLALIAWTVYGIARYALGKLDVGNFVKVGLLIVFSADIYNAIAVLCLAVCRAVLLGFLGSMGFVADFSWNGMVIIGQFAAAYATIGTSLIDSMRKQIEQGNFDGVAQMIACSLGTTAISMIATIALFLTVLFTFINIVVAAGVRLITVAITAVFAPLSIAFESMGVESRESGRIEVSRAHGDVLAKIASEVKAFFSGLWSAAIREPLSRITFALVVGFVAVFSLVGLSLLVGALTSFAQDVTQLTNGTVEIAFEPINGSWYTVCERHGGIATMLAQEIAGCCYRPGNDVVKQVMPQANVTIVVGGRVVDRGLLTDPTTCSLNVSLIYNVFYHALSSLTLVGGGGRASAGGVASFSTPAAAIAKFTTGAFLAALVSFAVQLSLFQIMLSGSGRTARLQEYLDQVRGWAASAFGMAIGFATGLAMLAGAGFAAGAGYLATRVGGALLTRTAAGVGRMARFGQLMGRALHRFGTFARAGALKLRGAGVRTLVQTGLLHPVEYALEKVPATEQKELELLRRWSGVLSKRSLGEMKNKILEKSRKVGDTIARKLAPEISRKPLREIIRHVEEQRGPHALAWKLLETREALESLDAAMRTIDAMLRTRSLAKRRLLRARLAWHLRAASRALSPEERRLVEENMNRLGSDAALLKARRILEAKRRAIEAAAERTRVASVGIEAAAHKRKAAKRLLRRVQRLVEQGRRREAAEELKRVAEYVEELRRSAIEIAEERASRAASDREALLRLADVAKAFGLEDVGERLEELATRSDEDVSAWFDSAANSFARSRLEALGMGHLAGSTLSETVERIRKAVGEARRRKLSEEERRKVEALERLLRTLEEAVRSPEVRRKLVAKYVAEREIGARLLDSESKALQQLIEAVERGRPLDTQRLGDVLEAVYSLPATVHAIASDRALDRARELSSKPLPRDELRRIESEVRAIYTALRDPRTMRIVSSPLDTVSAGVLPEDAERAQRLVQRLGVDELVERGELGAKILAAAAHGSEGIERKRLATAAAAALAFELAGERSAKALRLALSDVEAKGGVLREGAEILRRALELVERGWPGRARQRIGELAPSVRRLVGEEAARKLELLLDRSGWPRSAESVEEVKRIARELSRRREPEAKHLARELSRLAEEAEVLLAAKPLKREVEEVLRGRRVVDEQASRALALGGSARGPAIEAPSIGGGVPGSNTGRALLAAEGSEGRIVVAAREGSVRIVREGEELPPDAVEVGELRGARVLYSPSERSYYVVARPEEADRFEVGEPEEVEKQRFTEIAPSTAIDVVGGNVVATSVGALAAWHDRAEALARALGGEEIDGIVVAEADAKSVEEAARRALGEGSRVVERPDGFVVIAPDGAVVPVVREPPRAAVVEGRTDTVDLAASIASPKSGIGVAARIGNRTVAYRALTPRGAARLAALLARRGAEEITVAVPVERLDQRSVAELRRVLPELRGASLRIAAVDVRENVVASRELRPDESPRSVAEALREQLEKWSKPVTIVAMPHLAVRKLSQALGLPREEVAKIVGSSRSLSDAVRTLAQRVAPRVVRVASPRDVTEALRLVRDGVPVAIYGDPELVKRAASAAMSSGYEVREAVVGFGSERLGIVIIYPCGEAKKRIEAGREAVRSAGSGAENRGEAGGEQEQ